MATSHPIQFALLIPRVCISCKRDHNHAPDLRNFQPLGEAAMLVVLCALEKLVSAAPWRACMRGRTKVCGFLLGALNPA